MAIFNSKLLVDPQGSDGYGQSPVLTNGKSSISKRPWLQWQTISLPGDTGWGPQDSVQLPKKWLKMVDITILSVGVVSWFIKGVFPISLLNW